MPGRQIVRRCFPGVGCGSVLSDDLVVVGMAPDPEPGDSASDVSTDGSPVKTDASRPELTNTLEMYRRTARIRFHQFEAAVRELLHVGG